MQQHKIATNNNKYNKIKIHDSININKYFKKIKIGMGTEKKYTTHKQFYQHN